MLKKILLLSGFCLTVALSWFSVANYRSSFPLAEESLRGVARSFTAAVENIAAHDPALKSLTTLREKELAFLALLDRNGVYRFHSNPDLIGAHSEDARYREVLQNGEFVEGRIVLGTGEKAYEFLAPIHLMDTTLILQLTLHTYRADAVIRKAELNMAILFGLLLTGWILSAVIYRFALREEMLQLEMARQESLARVGEMGAMLAHEIRNPLGGIKGFAQIIEKKPTEARNSHFARLIIGEVLRLEELVTNLLSYAGSGRMTMSRFDLSEFISHAVSFVRPEMEQQGIELVCDCSTGLSCYGDRDRLGQVLLNLLKNSVQAMPEGGILTIAATVSATGTLIKVGDTGEGISNRDQDRVFEPFFTTRAKGTGLGLALSRKIVSEHNGSIRITTVPGSGTTVSLELPGRGRT